MKLRKRILSAMLAAGLVISLAGCAENEQNSPESSVTNTESTSSATSSESKPSDSTTQSSVSASESKPTESTTNVTSTTPTASTTSSTESVPVESKPEQSSSSTPESKPTQSSKPTESKPTESKPTTPQGTTTATIQGKTYIKDGNKYYASEQDWKNGNRASISIYGEVFPEGKWVDTSGGHFFKANGQYFYNRDDYLNCEDSLTPNFYNPDLDISDIPPIVWN